MAVTFHPPRGLILMCDFTTGFREPEMVKRRPVIVISPELPGRTGLVTVVPLSTKRPDPVRDFHLLLNKRALPQLTHFQERESWAKCDMIYTVSLQRLNLIQLGKRGTDGRRQYFKQRLGRETMAQLYGCVLHGIGLPRLAGEVGAQK